MISYLWEPIASSTYNKNVYQLPIPSVWFFSDIYSKYVSGHESVCNHTHKQQTSTELQFIRL